MTRTRASAKAAGARFERVIADYLAAHIDDRIDRRVKTGSNDRGDIAALRSAHGKRVVAELKDCARLELGTWKKEADVEAGNDDAIAGVVVHKRFGNARPGDQWVHMTVDDLIALITGVRP
jgi:hypothetical protein